MSSPRLSLTNTPARCVLDYHYYYYYFMYSIENKLSQIFSGDVQPKMDSSFQYKFGTFSDREDISKLTPTHQNEILTNVQREFQKIKKSIEGSETQPDRPWFETLLKHER